LVGLSCELEERTSLNGPTPAAYNSSLLEIRPFHFPGRRKNECGIFDSLIDVGLYLNPPDQALVLCVDEKRQVQALERTQPVLPTGLGYIEGIPHDYYRHGTTTLFAALDVLDGSVITRCRPRHRHQEFLGSLKHLDRNVPPGLDFHLIADNYSTHKHSRVKAWLVRHPPYHLHYTPTYASWLNQVERWFGLITQQAIRRGSFPSVKELVQRLRVRRGTGDVALRLGRVPTFSGIFALGDWRLAVCLRKRGGIARLFAQASTLLKREGLSLGLKIPARRVD
jgi:hypothetical protein